MFICLDCERLGARSAATEHGTAFMKHISAGWRSEIWIRLPVLRLYMLYSILVYGVDGVVCGCVYEIRKYGIY